MSRWLLALLALVLATDAGAEQFARRLHSHAPEWTFHTLFNHSDPVHGATGGLAETENPDPFTAPSVTGVDEGEQFALPEGVYLVAMACVYRAAVVAAGDIPTLCVSVIDSAGTTATATAACVSFANGAGTLTEYSSEVLVTLAADEKLAVELESFTNGGGATDLEGTCLVRAREQ